MFENMSVEDVMGLANKVGHIVAREHPGVDAEDIAQEALTGLIEKVGRIKQDDGSGNYYFVVMREIGRKFAKKERAHYQQKSADFLYRPQDVRMLLESFFAEADVEVPIGEDDLFNQNASLTELPERMDLVNGLDALYSRHLGILRKHFVDGEECDRKSVSRAIGYLTEVMNGRLAQEAYEHEGPGARHAMSNAEAQHMTRNQW